MDLTRAIESLPDEAVPNKAERVAAIEAARKEFEEHVHGSIADLVRGFDAIKEGGGLDDLRRGVAKAAFVLFKKYIAALDAIRDQIPPAARGGEGGLQRPECNPPLVRVTDFGAKLLDGDRSRLTFNVLGETTASVQGGVASCTFVVGEFLDKDGVKIAGEIDASEADLVPSPLPGFVTITWIKGFRSSQPRLLVSEAPDTSVTGPPLSVAIPANATSVQIRVIVFASDSTTVPGTAILLPCATLDTSETSGIIPLD